MAVIPARVPTQVTSIDPTVDTLPVSTGVGGVKAHATQILLYQSTPNALAHYRFNTTLSISQPGSGFLRLNSSTPTSATILSISGTTIHSMILGQAIWKNLTSGEILVIRQKSNPTKALMFRVTGATADQGGTPPWFIVPIVNVDSQTLPDNNAEVEINFISAVTAATAATSASRLTAIQTPVFSTSLLFNATNETTLAVTLTDNTRPGVITGVTPGDRVKYEFTQDATGGRHVNFSNFSNTDAIKGISKVNAAKTVVNVDIMADSSQVIALASASSPLAKRLLYYVDSDFNGISSGAPAINDRVAIDGVWTYDEVRQYEYCFYTDIQYSGANYSQGLKDKLHTLKANVPSIKVLSYIRQDLWWFWNEQGWQFPERAWGAAEMVNPDGSPIGKPTFAMGNTPAGAPVQTWAAAQASLLSSGYIVRSTGVGSEFDDVTNSGTLLTSPYEIALFNGSGDTSSGGAAIDWYCRNNVMNLDPFDTDGKAWLDLLTDFLVAQRKLEPDVDGYYIQPQKFQRYDATPNLQNKLDEWMRGVANSGWVQATDSGGGTTAAWSASDLGEFSGRREQFTDVNFDNSLVDVFDSERELVDLLRAKDPGAIILYSPYNGTVDSWRDTGSGYRSTFQSQAITKHSFISNNTEADQYWADQITYCAGKCDGIEFEGDDDINDFIAPWAKNIRELQDKFVLRAPSPQDISDLAQQ